MAADPQCGEEGETYNEIFIARIPYQEILDYNKDDTFDAVMSDTREQIAKLVHDILHTHSKPSLSQRNLTWIINRARLGSIITTYFGSNG